MRSHSRLKRFFCTSVAALFILAVAAAKIVCAQGMAASAWPCKGYDAGRTGQSLSVGAQANAMKWKYQTGNRVHSSPAIGADGTIYVGSMDNKLYALKPNGSLLWSYVAGDKIYSSPAIGGDGTIYVGSCDGKIYALKPDGSLKWASQIGWDTDSSPVIGMDGTIYIGSHDGRIYAINPLDGSVKWSYQTAPMYMYSSPAIGADGTVFVAGDDGQVYALKPADGTPLWICRPEEGGASFPLVGLAVGQDAIYVGSLNGKVYALELNGHQKWSYPTNDQVHSSPAIGRDGTIYVGSHDRKIYALNPDGTLKWSCLTAGAVYSSPAIAADGTIYVGSLDGAIYAFRPDGSLVWSYRTRGQIYSSPAIADDGTVYIASYDYRIYAFSAVTCMTNKDCPAGSFCQKGVGDCQEGAGVCSNKPQTCPGKEDRADPVCGCDGKDYSNWCQAAASLTSLAHTGACASAPPQPSLVTEICDGKDNDADGLIDEDLTTRPCTTQCGQGEQICQNGAWSACSAAQPQIELCDGKDNDCDDQIDEGVQNTYYQDADGDGYGHPAEKSQACSAPGGSVANNTDCNDADTAIHPSALEVAGNGKDDDCQGGDAASVPGGQTENDTGALDIQGVEAAKGQGWISIPIRIQSAPNEIRTLSFEVTYDPSILKFSGEYEPGALADPFPSFEINSSAAGLIKVRGSSSGASIPKGASGYLIWLKFEVLGSQEAGQSYSLKLQNLGNDLADFTKSGGILNVVVCNWDLNGDGTFDKKDAEVVYHCYLETDSCPLCADVNLDGEVTPGDARCLVNKSAGLPSCLD